MQKHLLVTNDYPPKIGGIQNYLWELWRRLPPESFAILTRPYAADLKAQSEFDESEPYSICRSQQNFLLPTTRQLKEIEATAYEFSADLIIFDPAIPVGDLGPKLNFPYAHIFHGAEVTIPTQIPGVKKRFIKTLTGAKFIITASRWAVLEAEKICPNLPPWHYIPPGVEIDRFLPLDQRAKAETRSKYNIDPNAFLVVSVSRLVPRKGMDCLIQAVARLKSAGKNVELLIAGTGRDEKRLRQLIKRTNAPARLLGRVSNEELPQVYGMGDVFAMACRTRWNGLEQEGFGIVFMEAASCGVASLAGKSGGADEAVLEGETGIILEKPKDPVATANALADLMDDPIRLEQMGKNARRRAETDFSYDILAKKLQKILQS